MKTAALVDALGVSMNWIFSRIKEVEFDGLEPTQMTWNIDPSDARNVIVHAECSGKPIQSFVITVRRKS